MSEISKQALLVDNSQSFPNNNAGAITPSDLRAFNVNMIDSLVDEITYNVDSASWNKSISALNTFTSSQQPSFTALNQFTASQLSINSGVNGFTQSTSGRLNALESETANLELFTSSINEIRDAGVLQGYSTRFFFGGLVSASIVQNVNGPIASINIEQDGTKLNTSSFDSYTASLNSEVTYISGAFNDLSQSVSASIQELLALSSSLSGGFATQGELDQSASVLQSNIDTKLNTSSFNSFTASQNLLNGTFATTGSNVFTGDQTLTDAAGNAVTLSDASGSLMLVAKGFTSASAHLSASAAGIGNLIFKNNSNTADTIMSGSANIFTNANTPTAGFKRYIGGSNNYYNNINLPQITGSMQFSPAMNRNIGGLQMTLRGPVSSSTYTINDNIALSVNVNLGTGTGSASFEKMISGYTMSQNAIFGGLINQTAGITQIDAGGTFNSNLIFGATININHNSSSVNYVSNIQNGGITINNNYISASTAPGPFKSVQATINTVYGVNHRVELAGSNTSTNRFRTFTANLLAGTYITASLQATGDNSSMLGVSMIGNGLIVSGTSASPLNATPLIDSTYGSVIAGRFNAHDGNKAKSAETVFAVGTGTGYTNRKTGFLIDSGSNTFVEGSLNVSGSLSVTGSINNNVFSASIVSSTASIDFSSASFFTLTLPASTTTHISVQNVRPGQSAMVEITTAGTLATASFSTNVYQPSASFYVPTNAAGNDILTFSSFASDKVYLASVKTMINA